MINYSFDAVELWIVFMFLGSRALSTSISIDVMRRLNSQRFVYDNITSRAVFRYWRKQKIRVNNVHQHSFCAITCIAIFWVFDSNEKGHFMEYEMIIEGCSNFLLVYSTKMIQCFWQLWNVEIQLNFLVTQIILRKIPPLL